MQNSKIKIVKNALKDVDVRGLISDGDKPYKSIADDLEVPHQLCTFHLMNISK
jgi:hypothetical protein